MAQAGIPSDGQSGDAAPARTFRVGLVQLCTGRHVDANMRQALGLIRQAAADGAEYVQTPEVTTLMELDRELLFAATLPETDNPYLGQFTSLARELGIWLHIGSMGVKVEDGERIANRSYLISPEGVVAARYDKIHMFDCDVGGGEVYRESDNYRPGDRAVLAELPWGPIGLAICYDLRFPHLFRTLAQAGARFLSVPAAFTRVTGEAHWHTLLRARAIENQAFVFAAAQGGRHEHGRETFGHSLIVSPWGQILAEGGVEPGVVIADIMAASQDEIRKRSPVLGHDRAFQLVSATGTKTPV